MRPKKGGDARYGYKKHNIAKRYEYYNLDSYNCILIFIICYFRNKQKRSNEEVDLFCGNPTEGTINDSAFADNQQNSGICDESDNEMDFEYSENGTVNNRENIDNLGYAVENQSVSETKFEVDGNRIVNLKVFLDNLKTISNHGKIFGCTLDNLVLMKEKRLGLSSKLFFKCNMCNLVKSITTTEINNTSLNLNTAAVSAVIGIGIGYSQMKEFLGVLDIPCMTQKTYARAQNVVQKDIADACQKEMKSAAMEAKQIAIDKGNVDVDGVPLITVEADACFSKRTYGIGSDYSSLSACGSIVAHDTKKVIWSDVLNKFCFFCKRHTDGEVPTHQCNKTYEGPSTGMEAAIIVEGFKRSEELYGMRYNKLIADGDSSVYKTLIEVRPYRNTHIEKIECKNHLLRNMRKKLRELVKDTSSNILFRKELGKNLKRISVGIQMAIKHWKESSESFMQQVSELAKDIYNTPHHVFGSHQKCSSYFCNGVANEKEINFIPKMMENGFLQKLQNIIGRVSNHSKSLIYFVDSNFVEQFDSKVAKCQAGKRINFSGAQSYASRAKFAILQHNTQRAHYHLQQNQINCSPTTAIKRIEIDRQKKVETTKLKRKTLTYPSTNPLAKHRRIYGPDLHYGIDTCEKPDISEDIMQKQKDLMLTTLSQQCAKRTEIERETTNQSDSNKWHEIRRIRITASNFGSICRARNSTSYKNKVKHVLYSNSSTAAMQFGKMNENSAKKQLELQLNITISPCGIFIDKSDPCLAASPDGLVGEDGIVEIKCSFAGKNMNPDDAIKKKKIPYWKWNDSSGIVLNRNHPFYYQVQGQLNITERDYCYFAVWTGCNHKLKVERIERDVAFYDTMRKKLVDFYHNSLLPEIIDGRIPRNMVIREHQPV